MRFKDQTTGLLQLQKFGRRFLSAFHIIGLLALMFASNLPADQLQGVSVRNPSVPAPAGGNGDSLAPVISPDGRFVLFSSSANNLAPGDNGQLGLDVFLRDRTSNTTVLVSANFSGTGGGNGNSIASQVSTNGQYVAFQSDSSDLLAGDTNAAPDIFVRDVEQGTNILVSAAADGGWANGASTDPVMSPDGRYVAFISAATNLVAGDTNGINDIFVRDLVNHSTICVTAGAVKASRNFTIGSPGPLMAPESPVITPDGRYVAFFSTNDLGAGVPFTGSPYYSVGEVYVRDLVANTTIWASSNAVAMAYTNVSGNKFPLSYHPVISDDGQFIAFKTSFADRPGATAVFKLDMSSGTLTMLTTNSLPVGNGVRRAITDDLFGPEMTPDGRFIAYGNREGGTNFYSLYLWDSLSPINTPVSADMNGIVQTNAFALAPVFSRDGRFIAFVSNATNLVGTAISADYHVYLRDLLAGTNQLIDADTNGIGSTDALGTVPALSRDGGFVVFAELDGSLVAGDNNNSQDVFVRDTTNATTELISQRSQLVTSSAGNALSSLGPFSISADGHRAVYSSYASDLVTNDFNNNRDVFMADLPIGSNMLVSVGMDGNAASGGSSVTPVISADGHYVAFVSAATNLVVNDTNGTADVFLRNLDTGIITLVNVNSNGVTSGTGDASAPAISADGRYVVFLAKATPAVTFPGTFLKDTVGGRMTTLTTASGAAPGISADGQRVLWFSSSPLLNVWNVPTATTIYTFGNTVSSAVLSPTGNRVMYQYPSTKQLVVYNLAGSTNMFTYTSATPIKNSSPWSSDGRFVTFVSGAPLVANDNNGTNDVYLRDLQTGMLTLVSANSNWIASAGGISDSPTISADARFIAYRSFATDIVAGITNVPSLFLFDRTTGSNAVLATGASGSWTTWASQPVINSNGATAIFQSWNCSQATNNLNRVQDVFSASQNSLLTDSDGDGIPDWWMLKYFSHATGLESDLSHTADDADGDSISNLQEYQTGTDPTNPNSVLVLQISPAINPGTTTTLTWPAVPGKSYQVQYRDDLKNAAWLNYTGSVVVIGWLGSITVPAAQSSRFYRAVYLY